MDDRSQRARTPSGAAHDRVAHDADDGRGRTVDERKRSIRGEVRASRRARAGVEQSRAREGLTQQLTALCVEFRTRLITAYTAMPGEPDPGGLVESLSSLGIDALLPTTRPAGRLEWISAGGNPVVGRFGISEPVGTPVPTERLAQIDLMLVPACAVDLCGNRLGWGGGYFDRALASLSPTPPVYALVHESEIYDRLPREPHDVPVDGVVTPDRTLRFSRSPRR